MPGALLRGLYALDRRLPAGIVDLVRQLGLFFLIYQGYQVVRGLTEARAEVAFANAERIIDAERAIGLFFEQGMQALIIDHTWLVDLANFLYMNSHFVVTTTFLAWLYLRRNDHFYFVRNMFIVAMGLALLGYALFPTAPPRMFGELGFVDTIGSFAGVEQDSNAVSLLVNKYAAVPSMHIGFAAMVGGTAFMLVRNRALRVGWALYPVLVFAVVVVTANHYWLDAAAGLAVAIAAALVAHRLLARARPAVWAFKPREATA